MLKKTSISRIRHLYSFLQNTTSDNTSKISWPQLKHDRLREHRSARKRTPGRPQTTGSFRMQNGWWPLSQTGAAGLILGIVICTEPWVR